MNYQFLLAAIFFVAVAFVSAQERIPENLDCRYCDLSKCPSVGECPAGKVRDICGCCEVCGLEDGQLCDYSTTKDGKFWHGFCGYGMECSKRKDIDSKKIESQSVCVCEKKGLVCGSNGLTYTKCQLEAEEIRQNVTLKHDQPCQTRPQIVKLSESQNVRQGAKHTILCEVEGFPLPTAQWIFKVPGSTIAHIMPGDSEEIIVTERGGPEKTRLTSFLQIIDFQLEHEGSYECLASATDGFATKKVSLNFERSAKHDL